MKNNKQKAVVTGSQGFIGKHLVTALKKKNIEVYPILHHELTYPVGLEKKLITINPDYIYHLSAYGNMAKQNDEPEILIANIQNLWNLLQASRGISYKAFVNVSTSSVTLAHQTLYSATKMGGEYLCKAFADEYNKPIVSLRPYSVYGECEAYFRFIPTVFRACLKGDVLPLVADSIHDWVYVADVVKGLLFAANYQVSIEIGTGVATSNLEVVKLIEELTKKKANIKKVKTLRSFDTTEWKCPAQLFPMTSLLKGLTRYYESIK